MLSREDRRELVIHLYSLRFRRARRACRLRARRVLAMGWHR